MVKSIVVFGEYANEIRRNQGGLRCQSFSHLVSIDFEVNDLFGGSERMAKNVVAN